MSELEKELNYMMDMMYINGATSSSDPSAPWAYEWLSNRGERINDKGFVDDIRKIFYGFMGGVNKNQIARSNKIADGKNESKLYETILSQPWRPDENYYRQMMIYNNAESNTNSNVRKAYNYFMNPDNEGKGIPKEIKDAFNGFMSGVDFNQKVLTYERATGIELEGLKSKGKQSDGSYSMDEETIIQTGPYVGWKVTQGFNDTTNMNNGKREQGTFRVRFRG